jgi:hypothetical protein
MIGSFVSPDVGPTLAHVDADRFGRGRSVKGLKPVGSDFVQADVAGRAQSFWRVGRGSAARPNAPMGDLGGNATAGNAKFGDSSVDQSAADFFASQTIDHIGF